MKTDGFWMPPILVHCQLIRRWNLTVCLTHHGPTFEVVNTRQCQRGCQHLYSIYVTIYSCWNWLGASTRRGTGSANASFLDVQCFWQGHPTSTRCKSDSAWFGWFEGGSLVPVKPNRKRQALELSSLHRFTSFICVSIKMSLSYKHDNSISSWYRKHSYAISTSFVHTSVQVQIEIVFWDDEKADPPLRSTRLSRLGAKSSRRAFSVHSAKLFWVAEKDWNPMTCHNYRDVEAQINESTRSYMKFYEVLAIVDQYGKVSG